MGKYATKEQLTALVADMASKINIASGTQGVSGSYVPIGCIEAFMGVEAPPDFLVCDGSLHSIASYPQLADHFYEQFGASNHFGGNGTTTFAVPDLRGEFLRGTGTNSHTNQGSGANVGVHQDGTEIPIDGANENDGVIYGSAKSTGFYSQNADHIENVLGRAVSSTRDIAGVGVLAIMRPTNTSVLWCIKAIDTKFDPEIQMVKYSTDEQLIGTWIDGKKLYQRVIHGTTSSNSMINMTDIVSGGIPNADNARIIGCYATYTNSNGTWNGPIPNSFNASTFGSINIKKDASALYFGLLFDDYNNKPFTAIIQYTKTTD